MQNNTLKELIGEWVKIKSDELDNSYVDYIGKIKEYDIDFIKLSSYFHGIDNDHELKKTIAIMMSDEDSELKEILLGRPYIVNIEKVEIS